MCPSPPPFGIGLGPTNPWLISIAKETLGFRRRGISPLLRLLVPTFSLPYAPVWVTPSPSSQNGTLSYRLWTSLRSRSSLDRHKRDEAGSRIWTCDLCPGRTTLFYWPLLKLAESPELSPHYLNQKN